mmetsp:Transcript_4182/g.9954  ORF Transcript_4182/g.9954 Transcript_4182/m.9954 type:complete len:344 (-) Transcript_4182:252-1283(-)|eukprot:CAMPEP_0173440822 /NCGR_PEP_ID=MMETSP1357-20121228/23627_1 /TAXON_ID=77926 /ORGANISM="Hemiselmis rufescens, Strain PCC563" /LENGTH=343 /DNA_ID=CAMNT_0014406359 /DNA_START=208 /DNA_END=1239 /DNA_ORIENTATION=+
MPFPCKFFQEGRCNAGKTCKFSHDPSVLKLPITVAPCRYFLAGHCAAGDACKFAHVEQKKKPSARTVQGPALSTKREMPVGYAVPSKHSIKEGKLRNNEWAPEGSLASAEEDLTYAMETMVVGGDGNEGWSVEAAAAAGPSYAAQAQRNIMGQNAGAAPPMIPRMVEGVKARGHVSEDEMARRERIKEQQRESTSKECGICLERVLAKAEQFGLLDACDHVFCLTCIREWRSVGELNKEVKRSCPLCREVSGIVIPSSFVPDSQESKDQVFATYHDRLQQIHCKHFRNGDGDCPFGTSCLYRHEYRDGTLQRYEAPRLRLDEEGELRAVGQVMLCDMIAGMPR